MSGKGDPGGGDHPGYKVITLPADDAQASAALTAAHAAGFTLTAFDGNRAILESGYNGKGS